jgi:hypothetical protein
MDLLTYGVIARVSTRAPQLLGAMLALFVGNWPWGK